MRWLTHHFGKLFSLQTPLARREVPNQRKSKGVPLAHRLKKRLASVGLHGRGRQVRANRGVIMRRVLRGVICAGCLVAASAPLGAAPDGQEDTSAALAVQHVPGHPVGVRDELAMVLVGSALIGVAAAVRRAA